MENIQDRTPLPIRSLISRRDIHFTDSLCYIRDALSLQGHIKNFFDNFCFFRVDFQSSICQHVTKRCFIGGKSALVDSSPVTPPHSLGDKLQSDHSCGLPWIPESCLADGLRRETEAIQIMEHYGLDVSLAWYMQRSSYRWGEVNGLDIQSLTVRMERQRENIAGQHFQTPTVGESISLTHPMTGKIYTLTVHEVEQQELPERAFHDPNMEYPSHYLAMSYSLEPDISGRGFMIQDCTEGDRPRQKKRDPDEFAPVAFCNAAVIGVIGGADGPTSVIMGQSAPKLHAACSSLLFEPIVDDVEWRVVFSEKLMDDVDVDVDLI